MRNLEDHIGPDELASLPEHMEDGPGNDDAQMILRHLDRCPICADLVKVRLRLYRSSSQMTSSAGSCPDPDVWLEYVEGFQNDRADALLAHASQCDLCSTHLREAMELLRSDRDDSQVAGVESFTPSWQKDMAVRMAALSSSRASKQSASRRSNWLIRPLWAAAPVTAGIVLLLFLYGPRLWLHFLPTEAQLLAMAYDQDRRIPLRIPGGDPVPMASETRGDSLQVPPPTALLKLEIRAQKNLQREPDSPYWHQILGEVEILENDGLAARNNLEFAQTGDSSLPNLKSDLAAAWFLIGLKTRSAEAFAEAAELYSDALNRSNQNASILYFNRALCWERQNAVQNALGDLRSALAREKSSSWRKAIQEEIARLNATSSDRELASPSTPRFSSNRPATLFGDSYEDDLNSATTEWLPQWPAPAAQLRLKKIAARGALHRDRWLERWMTASSVHPSFEGNRALSAALISARRGNLQESLKQSENAVDQYLLSGNIPGSARALLAQIYALQRLDRSRDCLRIAAAGERIPDIAEYGWLRTQLILEEGSCSLALGNFSRAGLRFQSALQLSKVHGFLSLYMRALAGQSQISEFRGDPVDAWQMETDALDTCHRFHCSALREYTLIYNMVASAQSLGLPHVSMELMQVGTRLSQMAGDPMTNAYAMETLALVDGKAGDFVNSDLAFAEAQEAARHIESFNAVKLFLAEWKTDRAQVLLRRNDPEAAIDLLTTSKDGLANSDYQPGRIALFTELSAAQLAKNEVKQAVISASTAIDIAEATLPTLITTTQREQWQRENFEPYAQLIKAYMRGGSSAEAFRTWARFRSLPYVGRSDRNARDHVLSVFKEGTSSDPKVLALALIGDRYVGWLVSGRTQHVLRAFNLGDRAEVRALVRSFYHLCSNPDSNIQDIRQIGAQIYSTLIRPFGKDLGPEEPLWIDIDASLASLSFPAIATPDLHWLGSEREIRILPAWWTIEPSALQLNENAPLYTHTVILNGFSPYQSAYSEVQELSRDLPHSLVLSENLVNPKTVIQTLQNAAIFHFAGHASSQSGSTRLLFPVTSNSHPYLGAEDVIPIHLHLCQLVVLAACNTTSSNPDRYEFSPDLQTAFLRSGARAVVASHWDVDDHSTAVLMERFYKSLVSGSSPTRALQEAERVVQINKQWQHPYYWASFQLYSN